MAAADVTKVSILHKESIHCGFHLIPYIVSTVLDSLPSSTYVLVTDKIVASYHLRAFQDEFEASLKTFPDNSRPRFLYNVIAPGETSKSREGKAAIEDFLLNNACTRDTVILALGGGVIGDLVGFVAATFMRGVRFCQIPTTLLAMVDSSVGGKTAIDTPHGKNLIGAFWQPEFIFIDAAFLETLPAREFSNGMAEVVKTAAIWNEDEFASLESRANEIFTAIQTPSTSYAGRTLSTRSTAQKLLLSVIVGSISVKAHIVTIDERETGLRNLVNFGHTIGHAIEAVLTPTILHGECVSIGMILEAEVARQFGILGQVSVGRLTRCLKAYNLPVSLSEPRIASLSSAKLLTVSRLLDIMRVDKKNSGPAKKIVLLSRIGATYEPKATVVQDIVIAKTLSEAVKVIPGIPSKHPMRMATPGSKSISNRALVLAALGKGTCRLKNLLHSDDTQVMMTALLELQGAKFQWEDGGETLVVEGGRGSLSVPADGKDIYLGNAGTAARFLTTVCTLVQSSESTNRYTAITGNARMKQRPVGPLVDALRANGSSIEYKESEGCLPLSIAAGGLKGGRIQLAASVSSQYVSSVLLCAPYAAEPVVLELTGGTVISQPYIDMTIAMMRTFGIDVMRHKDSETDSFLDVYTIPKGTYTNPSEYNIESDASSATYPLAIAAITGTTCCITNIGSASLQGDARFAKEVLEPMGCKVVQTETETTVTGPPIGKLRALGYVDMEPMTDAFLTASVLAAVAATEPLDDRVLKDGSPKMTTRILGIANQRVKECNRIKAMIDQLAKFGVETKELDDGLEIYGKPYTELKEGCSIHCYDDHRVAMAFSVLGAVIKDTVLEEKRCVEKTWPNWWDDLQNKIGLKVEGVELSRSPNTGSPSKEITNKSSNSVILIGMRGSGKTLIGQLAAQSLSWYFLDADKYFEEHHNIGVREFVHERGWEAFRDAETAILKDLLETKSTEHVISLGGGIVETAAARELLKEYGRSKGPVVHIVREIDEIVKYLGEETARPAYGEPVTDVFRRRESWFAECSTYEFLNYTGILQQIPESGNKLNGGAEVDSELRGRTVKGVRNEVERFFKHIIGREILTSVNLEGDRRSYFLSLTYPDITPALPYIDELSIGANALELRVDLLRAPRDMGHKGAYIPPISYVTEQLAAIRQYTSLPIVFTVRSVTQGGSHPDNAEDEAFALFDLGVRLGCEFVDVEISWDEMKIREFVKRKGRSKIIASWHDWSGNMKWDGDLVKQKYRVAYEFGDVVKIVGKAIMFGDNLKLRDFVQSSNLFSENSDDVGVGVKRKAKPLIAINTGYEGQISRIMNKTFSPITHPLLTSIAAPGQLSFTQIQTALKLIGLLPRKKFYLLGTPISFSPSPTLHNTAFEKLELPHRYELFETGQADDDVRRLIRGEEFGGASVTIPLKVAVMPLLDGLTKEAKIIGAVNTIIPVTDFVDQKKSLIGDNTDWKGIKECILEKMTFEMKLDVGLVIGAGGTCRAAIFALREIGIGKVYLFNRTREKAVEVVDAFSSILGSEGCFDIEIVTDLEMIKESLDVIISTVPGNATSLSSKLNTIYLPPTLLTQPTGIIVDMAYRPSETPLITLAKSKAKSTGVNDDNKEGGWKCIRGVDVLLMQGYWQFYLWTGILAPRGVVEKRVREWYDGAN